MTTIRLAVGVHSDGPVALDCRRLGGGVAFEVRTSFVPLLAVHATIGVASPVAQVIPFAPWLAGRYGKYALRHRMVSLIW